MLATTARAITIVALAHAGWWFAAEKVLIAAPLSLAAMIATGPRLLRLPGDIRTVSVPLLFAGYAESGGLLVTVLHGYPASDVGVRMGLYGVLVVRPAPATGVDVTVPVHTLAGRLVYSTGPVSVPTGAWPVLDPLRTAPASRSRSRGSISSSARARPGPRPARPAPAVRPHRQRCGRAGHPAIPGMWANHCHNLAHAQSGMTLHLMYSTFA